MLNTSTSWRARYSRLETEMQLRGEGWGVTPPQAHATSRRKLSAAVVHGMDGGHLGARRASLTPSSTDRDLTYETSRSSPSRATSVSPVSLDERYYKAEEYFFSDPVMILNPKYIDPRNRLNMPAIVVSTQEGRTGSPVPNWMAPLGADDPNFLTTPEHECGLTEEEEMQIALDQEQWELEEIERRRNEQRRAKQARRQAKLDRLAADRQHAASTAGPRKKAKRRAPAASKQQRLDVPRASEAQQLPLHQWAPPGYDDPVHESVELDRPVAMRAMRDRPQAPCEDDPPSPSCHPPVASAAPRRETGASVSSGPKIPAGLKEQGRRAPPSPVTTPREASGSEPPRPPTPPFGPSSTPPVVRCSVDRESGVPAAPRRGVSGSSGNLPRPGSSITLGGYERVLAEKSDVGRRVSASGSPSIPQTVAELSLVSSPRAAVTEEREQPSTPRTVDREPPAPSTAHANSLLAAQRPPPAALERHGSASSLASINNHVADPVPFMRKGAPGVLSWSLRTHTYQPARGAAATAASSTVASTPPVVVSKPLHRDVVRMQGPPGPAPPPPLAAAAPQTPSEAPATPAVSEPQSVRVVPARPGGPVLKAPFAAESPQGQVTPAKPTPPAACTSVDAAVEVEALAAKPSQMARHTAMAVSPARELEGLAPSELGWGTPPPARVERPPVHPLARRGSLLEGLLAASGKSAATGAAVAVMIAGAGLVEARRRAEEAEREAASRRQLQLHAQHAAVSAQVLCLLAATVPAVLVQQAQGSLRLAPLHTRAYRNPAGLHSLNDMTMSARFGKHRLSRALGAAAPPTPDADAGVTLVVALLAAAVAGEASAGTLIRLQKRKLEIKQSLVQRRLLGSEETAARRQVAAAEVVESGALVGQMWEAHAAVVRACEARAARLEASRRHQACRNHEPVDNFTPIRPTLGGARAASPGDDVECTPQPQHVVPVPLAQKPDARPAAVQEGAAATPPPAEAEDVRGEQAALPAADLSTCRLSAASPLGVLLTPMNKERSVRSAAKDEAPGSIAKPPSPQEPPATPVRSGGGEGLMADGTPLTPTPLRVFRPSLFSAEGFSLTFAEMSRLSIASPMAVLPTEGADRRGGRDASGASPLAVAKQAATPAAKAAREASEDTSSHGTSSASPQPDFESDDEVLAIASPIPQGVSLAGLLQKVAPEADLPLATARSDAPPVLPLDTARSEPPAVTPRTEDTPKTPEAASAALPPRTTGGGFATVLPASPASALAECPAPPSFDLPSEGSPAVSTAPAAQATTPRSVVAAVPEAVEPVAVALPAPLKRALPPKPVKKVPEGGCCGESGCTIM